jgi:hypothetical protein
MTASSRSSARLAVVLVIGCTLGLGSALALLIPQITGITGLVTTLFVVACLLAIATAPTARAANEDQRYALAKIFLGIEFIIIVTWLIAVVFLSVNDRFMLNFSLFASLFVVPTGMLLFKFRRLMAERGLVDPHGQCFLIKVRVPSAIGILVIAAVIILFRSKLNISLADVLKLAVATYMAPFSLVFMYEGLVLFYRLLMEALETPQ